MLELDTPSVIHPSHWITLRVPLIPSRGTRNHYKTCVGSSQIQAPRTDCTSPVPSPKTKGRSHGSSSRMEGEVGLHVQAEMNLCVRETPNALSTETHAGRSWGQSLGMPSALHPHVLWQGHRTLSSLNTKLTIQVGTKCVCQRR